MGKQSPIREGVVSSDMVSKNTAEADVSRYSLTTTETGGVPLYSSGNLLIALLTGKVLLPKIQ